MTLNQRGLKFTANNNAMGPTWISASVGQCTLQCKYICTLYIHTSQICMYIHMYVHTKHKYFHTNICKYIWKAYRYSLLFTISVVACFWYYSASNMYEYVHMYFVHTHTHIHTYSMHKYTFKKFKHWQKQKQCWPQHRHCQMSIAQHNNWPIRSNTNTINPPAKWIHSVHEGVSAQSPLTKHSIRVENDRK